MQFDLVFFSKAIIESFDPKVIRFFFFSLIPTFAMTFFTWLFSPSTIDPTFSFRKIFSSCLILFVDIITFIAI